MKKLRMIVTSVVVLAIVGSAFAFKMKGANFCVQTGATANQCDAIVTNRQITTGIGTTFNYFANWLGDRSQCTGTNANCTSVIKLTTN